MQKRPNVRLTTCLFTYEVSLASNRSRCLRRIGNGDIGWGLPISKVLESDIRQDRIRTESSSAIPPADCLLSVPPFKDRCLFLGHFLSPKFWYHLLKGTWVPDAKPFRESPQNWNLLPATLAP